MKHLLFETQDSWSGLLLRVTAGFVMLPHGAQKLLGMFGGYGYKSTMGFFQETVKLPWIISFGIIFIEFFGALGLITGLFTRVWALGLVAIMAGAIYTTNMKNGFFMNWFGNQAGEGFEYHILFIGMCLTLMVHGGGKLSVDRIFM